MLHLHRLRSFLSTCATSAGDSPLLELCTRILHTSDRVPPQPLLGFPLQHKHWWAKDRPHRNTSGPPITANVHACAQQKLNQVSAGSSRFRLRLEPCHSGSTRKSQTFLVICLLKATVQRATLNTCMWTRTSLKWAPPEGPQMWVWLNCTRSCRRLWNHDRGMTRSSQMMNTASGTTELVPVTVESKLEQHNGDRNAELKLDLAK